MVSSTKYLGNVNYMQCEHGKKIEQYLIKIGMVHEPTIRLEELAKLITDRTRKNMSRQRLRSILTTNRLREGTLKTMAEGLGVSVPVLLGEKEPKKSRKKTSDLNQKSPSSQK